MTKKRSKFKYFYYNLPTSYLTYLLFIQYNTIRIKTLSKYREVAIR